MRPFYPHQKRLMGYALREVHPALFAEMRLGKTLVALRRCAMYDPRDPRLGVRVLVAAPTSALGSWKREAEEEEWLAFDLTGERKARAAELEEAFLLADDCPRPGVCLVNKEGWIALPKIAEGPWDAVIADESTFLKNPTARVTKFFCKNFREVPHRWILTGTPCPEGEHEYFCQLQFLRGGAFGFQKFWDFRAHYMEPHPAGFGWVLKPGAPDHLRRVVGRTCCVMRRKDAKMDRQKVYERREIELPKEARKRYDEIEAKMADGDRTTKWEPVKWNWLRQLCGGFADGQMIWDGKIRELVELLKTELAKEQIVVWCSYHQEVREIAHVLRGSAWWTGETAPGAREVLRKAFQAGEICVLVLQQATAQTGCDLSAADTAIYFSTPPGYMARVQTEDRILSLKKAGPLLYVDLVVKNSVDEDVLELLQAKKELSDLSLSRALEAAMRKRRSK